MPKSTALHFVCALVIGALCLIAQSAAAALGEKVDYVYYTADATAGGSLLSILNAATPIRDNGQPFHGDTHWNVDWHITWFEEHDGRCHVTATQVNVASTIKLPQLIGAHPAMRKQFDAYLQALRIHELGHHAIGKNVAVAAEARLNALPEMPSCKALESAARNAFQRAMDQFANADRQYDQATGHGKSQGAWLGR